MTNPVVIGNATLYCGDCMEILPTLEKVDAVVTDPPYGIGANTMTLGSGRKEFDRGSDWDNVRPDVSWIPMHSQWWCIWGGNYFTDCLTPTNKILVWHKVNDGLSFSECEFAWTNYSAQSRIKPHHWGGEKKVHPTQKPLAVMNWAISLIPAPSNSILDPFMGSGTTGVAAMNLGRTFIGIEREPKYFDIACERIKAAQDQLRLFA